MGGNSSRCGCFRWLRKNRKVAPIKSEYEGRLDGKDTTSWEIIEELRSVGFFTTCKKFGEVRITLSNQHPTCTSGKSIPRRLPPLMRETKPKEGKITYDKEERTLMVEIRRLDALKEKGRMARLHAERRQQVLTRKQNKMIEKIRRTEEKLRKGKTSKPQGKEGWQDYTPKDDNKY